MQTYIEPAFINHHDVEFLMTGPQFDSYFDNIVTELRLYTTKGYNFRFLTWRQNSQKQSNGLQLEYKIALNRYSQLDTKLESSSLLKISLKPCKRSMLCLTLIHFLSDYVRNDCTVIFYATEHYTVNPVLKTTSE